MRAYYFIDQNEQQHGPIPGEELGHFGILPDTYVWCEGMADWQQAKFVPELSYLFAAPAYQVPPQNPYSNPVSQNPTPANGYDYIPPRPSNYLTWAILTTIFCCVPFGIVGIVFASRVNALYDAGQYDAAEHSSRRARLWVNLGFWIGLGVALIYIAFWVIELTTMHSSSYYYNY